ncbi:hypothetical protein TNCV_2807721 [Trichonephila clavipes]|nr:hypothetical protein TNCV_2807721 [Trichonephila clavipes]
MSWSPVPTKKTRHMKKILRVTMISESDEYDLLMKHSEKFDTNNEEENMMNTRRNRKRVRLFSSSEDECEMKERSKYGNFN